MYLIPLLLILCTLKGCQTMFTYTGAVMENAKKGRRIHLDEPIYVRNRSAISSTEICGYKVFEANTRDLPFKLDLFESFTGSAFLVVNGSLDYEQVTSYHFKMAAYGCGSSNGTYAPTERVLLRVEDVNDNRPRWLNSIDGVVVVSLKRLQHQQPQQQQIIQQNQQFKQQPKQLQQQQQLNKQQINQIYQQYKHSNKLTPQQQQQQQQQQQLLQDNHKATTNNIYINSSNHHHHHHLNLVCLTATDDDVTSNFSNICRYVTSLSPNSALHFSQDGCLHWRLNEADALKGLAWAERIKKTIINNNNNNKNKNNNNNNNNNKMVVRVYAIDCGGMVSEGLKVEVLLDLES